MGLSRRAPQIIGGEMGQMVVGRVDVDPPVPMESVLTDGMLNLDEDPGVS